jgi:hypothetical protein
LRLNIARLHLNVERLVMNGTVRLVSLTLNMAMLIGLAMVVLLIAPQYLFERDVLSGAFSEAQQAVLQRRMLCRIKHQTSSGDSGFDWDAIYACEDAAFFANAPLSSAARKIFNR